MKKTIILLCIILGLNNVFAQEEKFSKKIKSNKYDRNSLTVLYLDFEDKYASSIKKVIGEFEVSDKYNDHMIDTRHVKAPFKKESLVEQSTKQLLGKLTKKGKAKQEGQINEKIEQIRKSLETAKIGNEIIAKWFGRNQEGAFTYDLFEERGLYNATNSEMVEAQTGSMGLETIKSNGLNLINNSYILLMDINSILTMDEFYDTQDALLAERAQKSNKDYNPVSRTHRGFKAKATGYLFQVDYNDTVQVYLYNDYWMGDAKGDDTFKNLTEEERLINKKWFDEFTFPIKYIETVKINEIGGMQSLSLGELEEMAASLSEAKSEMKSLFSFAKKNKQTEEEVTTESQEDTEKEKTKKFEVAQELSDVQLFTKLVENGLEKSILGFSKRVEDFRVKANIYETGGKPKAQIGKKEGVKVDQRFFVYEKKLNPKTNVVKYKKVATLLATDVVDNRSIATGESQASTFVQTSGKKLYPGLLIQEKNDRGVSGFMGLGHYYGGMFIMRVDGSITKAIGKTFPNLQLPSGLRGYLGIGLAKHSEKEAEFVLLDGSPISFSIFRFDFGLAKDFYFLRKFAVAPFVGLGIEGASFAQQINTIEKGDRYGSSIALELGSRLRYNINELFTIESSLHFLLGGKYQVDEKIATSQALIEERQGVKPAFDLGIRVNL